MDSAFIKYYTQLDMTERLNWTEHWFYSTFLSCIHYSLGKKKKVMKCGYKKYVHNKPYSDYFSLLLLLGCFSRVWLCVTRDSSPPGSPVPGILHARTLEWVAISFSNAWKWKVKVKSLSHVWLLATPWTAAHYLPIINSSREMWMVFLDVPLGILCLG